jgi:hypothetical protein
VVADFAGSSSHAAVASSQASASAEGLADGLAKSSPQAAPKSSVSTSSDVIDGAADVEANGFEAVLFDMLSPFGRGEVIELGVLGGGTDAERFPASTFNVEPSFALEVISPLAAASLLVKDDMAQPAQEAASDCALPMRGALEPIPVVVAVVGGGRTLSGIVAEYFLMRARKTSKVFAAESRTTFSLSTRAGHIDGKILVAQSSSGNNSLVALKAINAAFLACTNGSRNERAKAADKTFTRV